MYAGIDYDQTQICCDSSDIKQIEMDEKGNNIYVDNYPNDHFQNGLGKPLCQFLAYIGSIEQTRKWVVVENSCVLFFNSYSHIRPWITS